MPCTAISPNDERFQPPKLWNAIVWMRLANSRAAPPSRVKLASASGSVPGPSFSARTRSPDQGFGYAVMNLGLGSGGSIIHTEMMQGFRPSGVMSEQRTSNF